MKKLLFGTIFSISITLILVSNSIAQQVIFQDDFSSGLLNWTVQGVPLPSISLDEGNPAPSFCTNGDGSYAGFGLSKETFNYIGNEFTYSADLKAGSSYNYVTFFLTKNNVISGSDFDPKLDSLISVSLLSNSHSSGPSVRITLTYDDSGEQLEDSGLIPLSAVTDWHNIKVKVKQLDGRVELYFDDNLKYTSLNPITPTYDGSAAIGLGNRLAWHDNVVVEVNSQYSECSTTLENAKCFDPQNLPNLDGVCRLDIYDSVTESNPQAEIGKGTGFLISPNRILTAWHNFEPKNVGNTWSRHEIAANSWATFFYTYEDCDSHFPSPIARTVKINRLVAEGDGGFKDDLLGNTKDWCIVEIDTELGIKPYQPSFRPVVLFEKIYELSHPFGNPLVFACGKVTSEAYYFTFNYFKNDIKNDPGCSGAPIFDENFQVVGIDVGCAGLLPCTAHALNLNAIKNEILPYLQHAITPSIQLLLFED